MLQETKGTEIEIGWIHEETRNDGTICEQDKQETKIRNYNQLNRDVQHRTSL